MKKLFASLKGLFCIFITLSLVGCASLVTDREFISYIEQFEKDSGTKVTYPIVFDTLEDNRAGYCSGYFDSTGGATNRIIVINRKYWKDYTNDVRLILLYHEMGHCSLFLDHDDSVDLEGCALFGMNSVLPSPRCIARYGPQYYINTITGKK